MNVKILNHSWGLPHPHNNLKSNQSFLTLEVNLSEAKHLDWFLWTTSEFNVLSELKVRVTHKPKVHCDSFMYQQLCFQLYLNLKS